MRARAAITIIHQGIFHQGKATRVSCWGAGGDRDLNTANYSPRHVHFTAPFKSRGQETQIRISNTQRICVNVHDLFRSSVPNANEDASSPAATRDSTRGGAASGAPQLRLADLEGQRNGKFKCSMEGRLLSAAAVLESQIIPPSIHPSIHPFVSDLHVVAADGKKRGRREEDEEEA